MSGRLGRVRTTTTIMKTYNKLFKQIMLPVVAIALPAFTALDARGGYPDGYYDSLNGKCGVALMKAVKAMADGHKEISYGSGTWEAFEDTDVRTVNGVDCWWDMYSSDNVPVSSGHPGMNVEHSVANSWWGKSKNAAYKDLVHLNPSNSGCEQSQIKLSVGGTFEGDVGQRRDFRG